MLSEEEKQAIKECERLSKEDYYGDSYFAEKHSIQILLNLLKKLQKENEELKQENRRIKFFSNNLYIEDYIPKRVIKNKIKEKQDKINKLHSASDCVIIDDLENQISVLQELLESSDENE